MVVHKTVYVFLLGALYLLILFSIFPNIAGSETFDMHENELTDMNGLTNNNMSNNMETNLEKEIPNAGVTRPRMVASLQNTASDTSSSKTAGKSSKTSGKSGTKHTQSSNPSVSLGLTNDTLMKLTKAIKSDADYLTSFVMTMSKKDINPFSTPPLTHKDMCIKKIKVNSLHSRDPKSCMNVLKRQF